MRKLKANYLGKVFGLIMFILGGIWWVCHELHWLEGAICGLIDFELDNGVWILVATGGGPWIFGQFFFCFCWSGR